MNETTARTEAMNLAIAIKNSHKKNPIEDEKIVRMLTTRSKQHLKSILKFYKDIYGKIDEVRDETDDIINDEIKKKLNKDKNGRKC